MRRCDEGREETELEDCERSSRVGGRLVEGRCASSQPRLTVRVTLELVTAL